MNAIDSVRFGTDRFPPSFVWLAFAFCLCFCSSSSQHRPFSQSDHLSSDSQFATLSRPRLSPTLSSLFPGDGQCVARPFGCSLNCPGGYEGEFEFSGHLRCLCQCRLPISTMNCQAYGFLLCRPNERCTTQNGEIKCVPAVAPNQPVLPVNVVPLRPPSLPIRPQEQKRPSFENEQKYTGESTAQTENNNAAGGERTEGDGETGNDPCEGITCDENPLHVCQLVESDCEPKTTEKSKICPPVAKCLINPCPRGTPLRIWRNGITALCRTDGQCLDGWCHRIGYNGLGFCCPLPVPSLIKNGQCAAKSTKKRTMAWEPRTNCSAECRSDSDCASPLAKCCFDGCGLSCQLTDEADEKQKEEIKPKKTEETEEKGQTFAGREKGRGEATGAIVRPPLKKEEKPPDECHSLDDRPIKCDGEVADNECLEDKNCAGEAKCCLDECSLRCISPKEWQKKEAEKGQLQDLLAMNGECPQLPLSYRTRFCQGNQKGENGHDQCKSDDHCPFAQKCCVGPCDRRQCFYPSLEGNSECFAKMIAVRILAAINAGNKRIYEPKCDAKGQFEKEQKDGEFTFCVDEKGNELAGSRRHSDRFVGCDQKKRCPSVQCQLKCPFGFQFDSVGCALCQCRVSSCDGIACPEGMICRLVPHFCSSVGHSNSSCNVPECLPNVCLKGEPLEDARNGRLIQCDETDGGECPQGWHCRQIGTGPKGFCCSGMLLQAELLPPSNRCPAVPNLSYKWPRPGQSVGCRLNGECHNGESCCFDGVSTQCLALSEAEYSPEISTKRGVSDEIVMRQTKQLMPQGLSQSVSHLANCPLRLPNASSADCASNCASDADCARRSAFLRCCPFGCGMQCQFGDRLTPCVHLLASNLREVDKLAEVPISVGRPTVQCTEEGQFEKVQFDPSNGQFWCVDPLSGIESVGSRVSASPLAPVSPPDCSVRHFCKFNCSTTASNRCPHGLRMDHRGCPLDERCECRNPCEDFKCSLTDSEICLLKSVQCVDDSFCPPIPICVENVCDRFGAQSVGLSFCSFASDCQKQLPNSDRIFDCKFISSHLPFDRIGICCAFPSAHLFKEQSTNAEGEISNGQTKFEGEAKQQREKQREKEKPKEKQGLCPAEANGGGTDESAKGDCPGLCSSDSDCAGIQKCCPNRADGCLQCVQPILTTNCLNLLSAVLSLDSSHVEHSVPKPNCDPNTGAFSRVQCDHFGFCWCVRSASSASPLLGTRQFQPTGGESFCETPKVCPFRKCSTTVCPFGVEFDLDGCPLSSECRCRNPCDGIQCPIGQICLLRARDCLEIEQFPPDSVAQFGTSCLPVPICEPSPCGNVLKPLLNSALLVPQKCQLNSDNRPISLPQCPAAFQCIRPTEYSPSAETTPEGICCPRGGNDGNGAVENAIGEQQIDENEREKAIFCLLPVHQGNAVEKCGENRSELRYFYDSQKDKCEAFLFAGCGGNANNFKLKSECEKKCETMENRRKGKATERIEVGFVINAKGHFRTMENSLRDYLRKTFDLTEGQIRKVRVDGPTEGQVKFTVAAPDAREKAKRISETLALGHFQFPLSDGHLVRAQTDGWWTKRKTNEEEEEEEATGKAENMETEHIPLFWVLFLSVAIFAFVVLLVPFCAFLYLRARPRDDFVRDSIGHDSFSSPSPRVGAHHQNNWNPTTKQRKDGISTTPTVLMEEAEENVHTLRMRTTAFGREVPSQAMREDNFLPIPSAFPSSPSPDASSNASTHFGTRQQQIIAPRIVAEERGEEEQIRRGENTAMRRTWKWAR